MRPPTPTRPAARSRRPVAGAAYIQRINLAIDYVVANLTKTLRLARIAETAGLSPYHFHRVFQVMVGVTPADFIKRLRLERAVVLMAGSRSPALATIATRCGFASASDFSRCFKQRFGASPSVFDLQGWLATHRAELEASMPGRADQHHLRKLPAADNPDGFRVRIRDLPARTVAYIRVSNPYRGDGVAKATQRLMNWAERHGFAGRQWLGYQWDNPEVTALKDCHYYVAVEADHFKPTGEIGRYRFPPMIVAQVELHGDIHLELRALQWLYGSWLPRSGYVPDDQPAFEAWIGRPFAHGTDHFALHAQLPIRRG